MIKLENYSLIEGENSEKFAIAYDDEDAKISFQESLQHYIKHQHPNPDEIIFFNASGELLSIVQDLNLPDTAWKKIISEERIFLLCFSEQNATNTKLKHIMLSEKEKSPHKTQISNR